MAFNHPIWKIAGQKGLNLVRVIISAPYYYLSLGFNWALYYFRKWVLQWSEERNWGRHYEKRLRDQHFKKRGTVAIFNQNFDKYSETFVQGQLGELDYRKLYFYGWPSPMNEKALGNLVANHKFLRGFWYSVMQILNVDKVQYENKLLSNCLKKYKADIIVAHFGLMGARLVDVAVNSGIPMIVVFHGYDAWHSDQLKASEHNYKILFEEAAHVVGVSQDICQQLQRLGCPVSKISYLPAYVSSMYFEEHSLVEPSVVTFLSVGRFAMTKAPFLLIEVFSRVAKELPDSKLVMVGADDGGNLFEACHILAKGLGIEKQVIFKGSLGREEVMNEMLHATMLVQHSVKTPLHDDKEGTPVGIMEAMLLGLPIVATAHAGISEMIENEVSGLLVEEYDVDGMADSMLRLAKDDRLRKTLGAKAAEIIRSKEEVMRNTELFSEIIDQFKLRR